MKLYLCLFILFGTLNSFCQEYQQLDDVSRTIIQSNLENSYSNLTNELKVTRKTDKQVVNLINISLSIQDNLKIEIKELKAKVAALEADCTTGNNKKTNSGHLNKPKIDDKSTSGNSDASKTKQH